MREHSGDFLKGLCPLFLSLLIQLECSQNWFRSCILLSTHFLPFLSEVAGDGETPVLPVEVLVLSCPHVQFTEA